MSFRSGHLKIHTSDILSKIAANWRDLAAQYFTNIVKQQYFIFYQRKSISTKCFALEYIILTTYPRVIVSNL